MQTLNALVAGTLPALTSVPDTFTPSSWSLQHFAVTSNLIQLLVVNAVGFLGFLFIQVTHSIQATIQHTNRTPLRLSNPSNSIKITWGPPALLIPHCTSNFPSHPWPYAKVYPEADLSFHYPCHNHNSPVRKRSYSRAYRQSFTSTTISLT